MEGAFRLLVENCDNFQVGPLSYDCWSSADLPFCRLLQGLQMMHDTVTFGGFSHSFLTSFRDEFHKASVLNFSFLSGADPNHTGIDNVSGCSSMWDSCNI